MSSQIDHASSAGLPPAHPAGRCEIGTSGWHYRHWKGSFYPADLPAARWFSHYHSRFSSVELNAPFYRMPTLAAVDHWRLTSPDSFSFAIKGSRFITHNKKLADPSPPLARMQQVLSRLGRKLSVILFQLPPRWRVNEVRLTDFLTSYRRIFGPTRICFEFRDPSWNHPDIVALLTAHQAGYCIYQLDGYQSPLTVTADFAYVRLHGPQGRYDGEYGQDGLEPWRIQLAAWTRSGLDTYCYFDNDVGGHAPRDASCLAAMMTACAAGQPASIPQGLHRSTGQAARRRDPAPAMGPGGAGDADHGYR